ncbi:B3 domain-containing transcription factor LEC2 [Acorus calamus]|uniref:B3 domain-containing transcription factor LEC2 n=1 Tax=Acorus calamus TaxID=4465 RepID=A0AAV9FMJ4_ACOCL|nr:B3 domain-containing transcription factor LEC2 [Acorus calamus]
MVLNSEGDDIVPPSMTDASLNVPTRRSVGLSGLRGGGRAIMNNPMIRSVSGVRIPRPVMSASVASRPPASEFKQGYHMNMASNTIDVQQVQVTVGRFEVPAMPSVVLQLPTANNAYGEQPLSSVHGHQHNSHSEIERHHDSGVESTNFFKRKYEELFNNCYNQNLQLMQSFSTLYENPECAAIQRPVSITPKPPLLTQATRDPHNYGYNSTFSHASMKTQELNVPSWINNGVSRTSHSTRAQNVVLKDFSMSSMIHNNTYNIDFQSSSIYADQQQVNNVAGDISTSSQTFVPSQSELNLRYPLLNFSGLDDNKELEVLRMIPIIQKELQNSDVSHLGRIVLPKKDAETLLPQLSEREGLILYMEDVIVDGKKICRPADTNGDQVATIKVPWSRNGTNSDNYEHISPSVSEDASIARSEPVTSIMQASSAVNKSFGGLPRFDMNSLGVETDDVYFNPLQQ